MIYSLDSIWPSHWWLWLRFAIQSEPKISKKLEIVKYDLPPAIISRRKDSLKMAWKKCQKKAEIACEKDSCWSTETSDRRNHQKHPFALQSAFIQFNYGRSSIPFQISFNSILMALLLRFMCRASRAQHFVAWHPHKFLIFDGFSLSLFLRLLSICARGHRTHCERRNSHSGISFCWAKTRKRNNNWCMGHRKRQRRQQTR